MCVKSKVAFLVFHLWWFYECEYSNGLYNAKWLVVCYEWQTGEKCTCTACRSGSNRIAFIVNKVSLKSQILLNSPLENHMTSNSDSKYAFNEPWTNVIHEKWIECLIERLAEHTRNFMPFFCQNQIPNTVWCTKCRNYNMGEIYVSRINICRLINELKLLMTPISFELQKKCFQTTRVKIFGKKTFIVFLWIRQILAIGMPLFLNFVNPIQVQ